MRRKSVIIATGWIAALGVSAGWAAHELDQRAEERAVLDTVDALYQVISGDAGEPRDWDAFKALRDVMDPDEVFLTHYWRAHLGL